MKKRILSLSAMLASLTASAASFQDVAEYLDTDGSLVAYINFEGDGQEIGTQLNEIYNEAMGSIPGMMPIPIDFPTLFDNLGFGSVQAMGMSSKELEADLFANKSVALLDGAPTGLMAISGDQSSPTSSFTAAELAPVDATAAITGVVNLSPLRESIVAIATQLMGPMGEGIVQAQLVQMIPGTDITVNEAIDALSGKWDVFWKESYRDDFMPVYHAWGSIGGAADLVARLGPIAENMGVPVEYTEGGLIADLSSLIGSDSFGLFIESDSTTGAALIYTHKTWGPESEGPRLTSNEDFAKLAKMLPEEALSYSYTASYDLDTVLSALSAEPMIAPYVELGQLAIDLLLGDFLEPAIVGMYYDGDALISETYASYSNKQVVMAIPAVFAGGLGAAMAIPAFQEVRETSQEKTVINNLRMIASAADQYFLEEGATEVSIDQLMGPDGYIPEIEPVAGESYENMVIRTSDEEISVTLENGEVISIAF